MSADNYLLTEEQLLCCICLDVFSEPVTTPCGHNFCKKCIKQHLNSNPQSQCPMCNECVDRKCKFGVNTLISEMTVQFRQSAGRKDGKSSEQQGAKPGEVPPGTRLLPSYWSVLKYSVLFLIFGLFYLIIGFTFTLNPHKACPKHGKPLELYCKNEQMPICQSCASSSHRFHNIVPLKEEYEAKIKELQETKAVIQQKIQERHLKIQEVKHSVLATTEAADREIVDGVQVFTALTKTLDENLLKVIEVIEAKHQATKKQAEGFTEELEQEISELMERQTEVEQLLHSKDHLHFLQSFPFLNPAPLAGDSPDVSISSASYEGLLRTAMEAAVVQLTETATHEMRKLGETEWLNLFQNAVEVTLDPDTAYPQLIVSDDGKRVHYSGVWNEVPDNPKRFDSLLCVLGKQSFSFGRFYYDVQVKGKTAWALGVTKESINRKGDVQRNPENGFWALFYEHADDADDADGHQYFPLTEMSDLLDVKDRVEKVRVFVDYEKGLVSFYNADSAALIYSFTGYSFTERLHPILCPIGSDPLILTPAVSLN